MQNGVEKKSVGFGAAPEVVSTPLPISNGTTSVSAPLTSIPRRTSIGRSSSEISLRHIAPIKPPQRQNVLGTRTSAQRNESALKLDLKSIRATNVEKALGSAPVIGSATSPLATPSLLRKKSGELIKPALKAVSSFADLEGLDDYINAPRSAPVTPGAPKFVHFDAQLEKVKLFLADQKPQVVSRDGSPTEGTTSEGEEFPFPNTDDEEGDGTQLEIRLPNFSTAQPHDKEVYLESMFLDEDRKNLKGVVRVKNIAYDKWVAVRFTYDWWQTTSETSAAYKETIQAGQYDRFQFTLKLPDMMAKIEEKKLFICLRYTAGGRDIWDSNDGQNYLVTFVRVPVPNKPRIVPSRGGAGVGAGMGKAVGGKNSQWDLAGNKQDRLADLRMHLDRLSAGDDQPSLASQGALKGVRAGASRVEGLPRPRESGLTSPQPSMSPLGQRYDFGASLSSARGGKIRSPTPRSRDLPPGSPTGLAFASDAVTGPTFEFYSPQLSNVDLPPKPVVETPVDPPTPKASALMLDNLPVPVLKVEEPSPPANDYFMPSAPAATAGPIKHTHSPPRTALPRMYSEPPFARSPQRTFGDLPSAGSALGIKMDGIDPSLDASPPSVSNSSAESSLTDSPPSPNEIDLPAHARAPSFDDIANMSYKSILEQ